MASPYHPDLAARARLLPRGVARRWSVPLLKRLMRWAGARTRSVAQEVPLGECSVFVYRPRDGAPRRRPALLWIHGGGLLFGDARQDEALLRRVVRKLGVVVASVQYRFAPEHPFPAPLDDCARALTWLSRQEDVDPARIAVGGASAGGGLAAALCQRVRGPGAGPRPIFQLLVYPMLDDRSSARADVEDRLLRLWDRRANAIGWGSYLKGHDPDRPPPLAVPARAEDPAGLPPAWIGVGDRDLFHDEDLAYAAWLERGGVQVELELVRGAYHGFDAIDRDAPISRAFHDAQLDALARHLGL
ncbi:MAG: alpha/beta hydrolase [Nannocystaceae bacterium]